MSQQKTKYDLVIADMVASGVFRVRPDGRIETCYQWRGIREYTVPWYVCDRLDGKGYRYVSFRRSRVKAHRLAYALYNEEPHLRGLEINHLDGNKLNNRKENLELCSASRQSTHAYETGLNPAIGEQHALAQLTPEIVRQIRSLRSLGVPYTVLAQKHGVTPRTIALACKRVTWSHVL